MITFTIPSFIFCIIFVIVCLMFIFIQYIIYDIRSNKTPKEKKVKSPLKIGGIYGRKQINGDENNPFSPIRKYAYYVVILDIKPSIDGHCDYCQYVFLNDNMSPYSSYSDPMIYSDMTKRFDDWEYIKDIDLETILFS